MLTFCLRFVRARAHVRAQMTQIACAVGMRNAILRNHLKDVSSALKRKDSASNSAGLKRASEKLL